MTEIGSPAPDLTLPDQYGRPTSLEQLRRGRAVLLVFYPFAFSRICTGELTAIQADLGRFDNERVSTVGISCDPIYSLKAWAGAEGLELPLLSDFWPHGEVARAYDVFDAQAGRPVRGTFLVDAGGVVRWRLVNPAGEARDFDGFHRALAALPSASD